MGIKHIGTYSILVNKSSPYLEVPASCRAEIEQCLERFVPPWASASKALRTMLLRSEFEAGQAGAPLPNLVRNWTRRISRCCRRGVIYAVLDVQRQRQHIWRWQQQQGKAGVSQAPGRGASRRFTGNPFEDGLYGPSRN
jgi:hypothetical protein